MNQSKDISLSIIIPLYNSGKWFDQLSRTLHEQNIFHTEPDIPVEVIFVDDGSDDGSCEVIEQFISTHPQVHLFRQKNQGQGEARNHGLREARMKYVYMMDQDDILEPGILFRLLKIAEEHEAEILRFRCDMPDHTRAASLMTTGTNANYLKLGGIKTCTGKDFIIDTDGLVNETSVWTSIFRRDFILSRNINFVPEVRYLEDMVFVWKAMLAATRVVVTDIVGYHWIQYPQSDFNNSSPQHIVARRITLPYVARAFHDCLLKETPTRQDMDINRLIQLRCDWYTFAYWSLVTRHRALAWGSAGSEMDRQESWGIYPMSASYPTRYPQLYPQSLSIKMRWWLMRQPWLFKLMLRLLLSSGK